MISFLEWMNKGNLYTVKSPAGQEVSFIASRPNLSVVVVNPHKLDHYFAMSSNFYVGPQGEGGIEGRYPGFQNWLSQNPSQAVQMSVARFTSPPKTRKQYAGEPIAWQVNFDDGRHRFAWFRDQGFRELPIQVPRADMQDFQKMFG